MTLHSTPFSSYTSLASANSEASDWRPTYTGAHRLLFARFFYVRSSLPLRADCAGSLRTRRFPVCRYANLSSLPTPIGVAVGRFLNLIQETAMQPTYNLTHAVRQYLRGNLSTQDAQDLAFSICLDVKNVLTVLSDALKQTNRLSTEADIARTLETCAALIETANEIQAKEE